MIEIDHPPDIKACAHHSVPLLWLWSPRTERWCAFSTVVGDPDLLRVHRCERHGLAEPSWRSLVKQDPKTIHAGAQRVRQELASKEST